jgi:hypothetical protein
LVEVATVDVLAEKMITLLRSPCRHAPTPLC